MGPREKYHLILLKQQLHRDKKAMFKEIPNTSAHEKAVAKYDKHRLELKSLENQFKTGQAFIQIKSER